MTSKERRGLLFKSFAFIPPDQAHPGSRLKTSCVFAGSHSEKYRVSPQCENPQVSKDYLIKQFIRR